MDDVDTRDLKKFSRHDPHNPGDRPGTELAPSPEISETPGVEVSQTQKTADQPSGDTAPVTNDNHSSVNDGSEDSRTTAERTAEDGESEDDTSSKPTVNYVVAVFKMVKRKSRDRIRVLSKETFEKIAEGGDIKGILRNKYDHWMEDEGIEECQTELAAWEAAIEKSKGLSKERSPFDLNRGEKNRCVYVFEMNPNVIKKSSTFRKMNKNVLSKNQEPQCVYVGETEKEISKRFDDHRSADHRARTKWGKTFFLPEFDDAFRKDLLVEFQETGQSISGLNTYEALNRELALRKWLQDEKSIAAYSN
jgi:DNA-binding protein